MDWEKGWVRNAGTADFSEHPTSAYVSSGMHSAKFGFQGPSSSLLSEGQRGQVDAMRYISIWVDSNKLMKMLDVGFQKKQSVRIIFFSVFNSSKKP